MQTHFDASAVDNIVSQASPFATMRSSLSNGDFPFFAKILEIFIKLEMV